MADPTINDRPNPPVEITPLEPAPTRKVKPGDDVTCVTARDGRIPAVVKTVRKNGQIDMTFDHRGETMTITSSPYDPTGQTPDSWH